METSYKLYERLLRLGSDWVVTHIDIDDVHDAIHITISYRGNEWLDKQTGELLPIFDYRQERIWRHLDSMEHATFIHSFIVVFLAYALQMEKSTQWKLIGQTQGFHIPKSLKISA